MGMIAQQLFEQGKVTETIGALGAHLRDHPTDTRQRTFLFELLCFSGQYDRAAKQLAVLAGESKDAELGAVLYYSALHGEKTRADLFRAQEFPEHEADDAPQAVAGTLNGKPFRSIRDADPDIGPRLELIAAGSYMWLPFRHIASLRMEAPKRLRDTLWAPAFVTTGPSFNGAELGEVIIPVIYPFSSNHPDESIWLGRGTAWGEDEEGVQYPSGQKTFLVDGEEVPLLDVRTLEIETTEAQAGQV